MWHGGFSSLSLGPMAVWECPLPALMFLKLHMLLCSWRPAWQLDPFVFSLVIRIQRYCHDDHRVLAQLLLPRSLCEWQKLQNLGKYLGNYSAAFSVQLKSSEPPFIYLFVIK